MELSDWPQVIPGFVFFGLVANAVMYLLSTLVFVFKTQKFDLEQAVVFCEFLNGRRWFVQNQVDPKARSIHFALWFLPTYGAWIHAVTIFYSLKAKGPAGLIWALKRANDFKIFGMINYRMFSPHRGPDK